MVSVGSSMNEIIASMKSVEIGRDVPYYPSRLEWCARFGAWLPSTRCSMMVPPFLIKEFCRALLGM